MKNPCFAALALAACLVAAGAPAFGQAASPRTLTMSGQGEEQAAPDMVTLTAGATSLAPNAAAALSANSARMQAVFAALKKMGVADKDMQTANFNVSPQMSGGINNEPRRVTGYEVSNQVRVRLDDVNKLGTALDALVGAGANQIYGVQFSIKDEAALLDRARAKAVDEARAKAVTYAKAAGVQLGSILSISEEGGSAPRPLFRAVAMSAAAPTAAGEESVTANVSMVWEIH